MPQLKIEAGDFDLYLENIFISENDLETFRKQTGANIIYHEVGGFAHSDDHSNYTKFSDGFISGFVNASVPPRITEHDNSGESKEIEVQSIINDIVIFAKTQQTNIIVSPKLRHTNAQNVVICGIESYLEILTDVREIISTIQISIAPERSAEKFATTVHAKANSNAGIEIRQVFTKQPALSGSAHRTQTVETTTPVTYTSANGETRDFELHAIAIPFRKKHNQLGPWFASAADRMISDGRASALPDGGEWFAEITSEWLSTEDFKLAHTAALHAIDFEDAIVYFGSVESMITAAFAAIKDGIKLVDENGPKKLHMVAFHIGCSIVVITVTVGVGLALADGVGTIIRSTALMIAEEIHKSDPETITPAMGVGDTPAENTRTTIEPPARGEGDVEA